MVPIGFITTELLTNPDHRYSSALCEEYNGSKNIFGVEERVGGEEDSLSIKV